MPNTMTWEQWLLELDKVAAADNCERADDYEDGLICTWRPHYEAGLTPQQAWDAVPWEY